MAPPLVERSSTRINAVARKRWKDLTHLAALLKTTLLPEKHAEVEDMPFSGMSAFFHGLLQVVLWLSFAAFLFASLPHVAYFFATFEPQNLDGSISDYWWFVAYILAVAIDVTAFLLSFNVAVKMRRATAGKAWLAKIVPALMVIVTHWPFILILVGFSWLVNFEHAKEFHSTMLASAEQVQVNLLLWQGTLGDLNPIIASAFPVLAVAYTGMSDRIGDERNSAHKHLVSAATVSTIETAPVVPAPVQAPQGPSELEQVLQTMMSINQQNLQAMQVMNQQAMQVTIEQVTRITIEAVRDTVEQVVTALPPAAAPTALPAPTHVVLEPPEKSRGDELPQEHQRGMLPDEKLERGETSEQHYGERIEALFLANPAITIPEIEQQIGCSRSTAQKWLKRVKPVAK